MDCILVGFFDEYIDLMVSTWVTEAGLFLIVKLFCRVSSPVSNVRRLLSPLGVFNVVTKPTAKTMIKRMEELTFDRACDRVGSSGGPELLQTLKASLSRPGPLLLKTTHFLVVTQLRGDTALSLLHHSTLEINRFTIDILPFEIGTTRGYSHGTFREFVGLSFLPFQIHCLVLIIRKHRR